MPKGTDEAAAVHMDNLEKEQKVVVKSEERRKMRSERKKEYEDHLKRLIKRLEVAQQNTPKGRLKILMKDGRPEYYFCEEGAGSAKTPAKYISKKEDILIRALAQKEYDRRLLKEASEQLKKLKRMPENAEAESLEQVYNGLSDARKRLINPRIKLRRDAIEEWLSIPYEGKGFKDTDPEIYSEAGERVRSKSEKMIADKLRLLGIPYKYECPMELTGYGTIYPDFTLLNKHTLQPAVLEHFGIMDDQEYSVNAVAKVRTYERNNIFLGKDLFLTFETAKTPFDARSLETILSDFI